MKKFRWQLLIILVTGFVVGVLLIVQQLNTGENVDSTPSPVSGGTYTEALIGEFMRLNPFLDIYNEPDNSVDQLIFNGLVKFDSEGNAEADLAESWGISQDGTIYNFSLRDDVYWHDGEVFDSSDVLFTIGILQSGNSLIPEDLREFWAEIEVVALSENLVQFLLPESFSPFLDYLTFGILPEHILGSLTLDEMIDDSFNLAPIGTGPFRFQRLLVEDDQIVGVVLEAFDAYFEGRPYLDEFIFRYYSTSEEALAAYQAGEVEGIGEVDNSILEEVLAESDLSIYTAREPLLTMVYLNLSDPEVNFLQTADFRRALMMAINRDLIIENIYNGQAVPANGPIMQGTWAYYDDLEVVTYDLSEAQDLFESTGVTYDEVEEVYLTEDDLEVAVTLLYPDTTEHAAIAQQIKSDWEALGVKVTLDAQPYETVIENLEAREYQTALVDINLTGSPDPDPYPFWGQAQVQSGQNYAEWEDSTASEYLEEARMTTDVSERERLYRNFQVLFMREMPSLPLFYPVYTYAITDDINGVNMGPIFESGDRFKNVNNWYILSGTETTTTQTVEVTVEAEE